MFYYCGLRLHYKCKFVSKLIRLETFGFSKGVLEFGLEIHR